MPTYNFWDMVLVAFPFINRDQSALGIAIAGIFR
jgi:hypothetical protein